VGVSPDPNKLAAMPLIMGRRTIAGSLIGGIKETQEMLDFCARKKVLSDIELISADQINEAYHFLNKVLQDNAAEVLRPMPKSTVAAPTPASTPVPE
jgi:D-arabinose 1-dehydrogenase-like Zn-dependent alcohol dehydrogenase